MFENFRPDRRWHWDALKEKLRDERKDLKQSHDFDDLIAAGVLEDVLHDMDLLEELDGQEAEN